MSPSPDDDTRDSVATEPRPRLLLCSAYLPLARTLQLGLREEGYSVKVTSGWTETFGKLTQTTLDGIVVDLARDKELLIWEREWTKLQDAVPVVLLGPPTQAFLGCQAAREIIAKPFSFERLAAVLERLIPRN